MIRILIIVCFCSCSALLAQNSNCKTQLLQLYADFYAKNSLANNKYVHINYTTVQTFDGGNTSTDQVDVYAGKEKNYMIGKSAQYYQDSQVKVAIVPIEKIIIIGTPQKNKETINVLALQDSLVKHCQLSACTTESIKGVKYQKIVLKVPPRLVQKYRVEQIVYHIDIAKNMFYQITIKYSANQRIKETLVRFNQLDYNYSGEIFKVSPLKKIYDPNGHLLPAYRNYEVSDYRH
ncbi:MAG: hypothetical protein JNM36_19020 [Chitinophagales bacterium]|nr:hypothetical protein [Chitinophagales bacterium]